MEPPRSMRAIYITSFGPISKLIVSTVPVPKTNPNTLLIRTTHVSPTHVDALYVQGKHQNNRRHAKPPFVLGMDFAGVVLSAPAGYRFRRGDRVYGSVFGAFAEYIVIDAEGPQAQGVLRVPDKWTNAEACAVGASGVIGLGSFMRAGKTWSRQREEPTLDEWCLVTGASGGLGVLAVQVAKALGLKVIALAGTLEKGHVLRRIGADAIVDYKQEGWEKDVVKITGGEGVAIVYDAVGMVGQSIRCCRYGGTIVVVGFAGRGGDMEKLAVNRVLLKGIGVVGYRFGEQGRRFPEETNNIWKAFDTMIEDGVIRPVVYNVKYTGLDDVKTALQDMEKKQTWGRAVVKISDEDAPHTARL